MQKTVETLNDYTYTFLYLNAILTACTRKLVIGNSTLCIKQEIVISQRLSCQQVLKHMHQESRNNCATSSDLELSCCLKHF